MKRTKTGGRPLTAYLWVLACLFTIVPFAADVQKQDNGQSFLAGRLAAASKPGVLQALLLVHPAYYAGTGEDVASVRFGPQSPPAFIVQAQDDPIGVDNANSAFAQLNEMKTPVELHIYPDGGHGYGLRPAKASVLQWPTLAEGWWRGKAFIRREGQRNEFAEHGRLCTVCCHTYVGRSSCTVAVARGKLSLLGSDTRLPR